MCTASPTAGRRPVPWTCATGEPRQSTRSSRTAASTAARKTWSWTLRTPLGKATKHLERRRSWWLRLSSPSSPSTSGPGRTRFLTAPLTPSGSCPCMTGPQCAGGDLVITRRNDRRLRSGSSWVRNGDLWIVAKLREDGSVTIRPASLRFGGSIVLPAAYVAEHLDLGYAVTAHRAQGVTTDASHVVVTATTTRENLYVAMTRGREENHAYVAIDLPDEDHSQAYPSGNPNATARSVLYGVLQHVGAEPSDHWHTLLAKSGLTGIQVEDVLASDAYDALSAELRNAEANHHQLDQLLPYLVSVRGFEDADDIVSVLHDRLARATSRPAESGRTRRPPRLIAGLIPTADGPMNSDMCQALVERQALIEQRAAALLDAALEAHKPWTAKLGLRPKGRRAEATWLKAAHAVAAYRDRYQISDNQHPLGPESENHNVKQKINATRAQAALAQARRITVERKLVSGHHSAQVGEHQISF